jgi:hypothetical protein
MMVMMVAILRDSPVKECSRTQQSDHLHHHTALFLNATESCPWQLLGRSSFVRQPLAVSRLHANPSLYPRCFTRARSPSLGSALRFACDSCCPCIVETFLYSISQLSAALSSLWQGFISCVLARLSFACCPELTKCSCSFHTEPLALGSTACVASLRCVGYASFCDYLSERAVKNESQGFASMWEHLKVWSVTVGSVCRSAGREEDRG